MEGERVRKRFSPAHSLRWEKGKGEMPQSENDESQSPAPQAENESPTEVDKVFFLSRTFCCVANKYVNF